MTRIALLAMLACLVLCAAACADPVVNGGFESGTFTGWDTAGTGATFAIISSGQYAGTRCAELTGTDGSIAILSQTIPVKPNWKYRASFYFKSSGSVSALDVHLEQRTADHSYAGQIDSLGAPSGSTPTWTQKTVTFNTTADTAEIMWYNATNLGSGVKLDLDEYVLTELGPADELMTNGGFEIGNYDGWMLSNNGSGASFAVTNGGTLGPNSGDYCSEATGVNGSILVDIEPVPWVQVQGNKNYIASLYWRTSAAITAFDSNLEEWGGSGYVTTHHIANDPTYHPGWTLATETFTTNPATTMMRWYNGANIPAGVKMYLDDVSIRPGPECDGMPCNGGFETGYPDFWRTGGSGVSLSVGNGGAGGTHSGSYCAQLTGTTGELFHLEQDFTGPVEGVTYEAQAYFRTTAPLVAIGITLVEQPSGHGISLISGGAEDRPMWSKVSATFTPTPGTTGYTWHCDENVPAGVTLYIDDCKIREAPACVGVPCNGGFETGDTDFWTFSESGASFGVTNVGPNSGSYCAVLTGITGALVNPNQRVEVSPSTTYVASVYYRSAGEVQAFDSHIDELKSDLSSAGRVDYVGTSSGETPNWTKLSTTFTTKSTTHYLSWYNGMNLPAGVKLFLDDFQISLPTYTATGIGSLRSAPLGTTVSCDAVVTRVIDETHFFVESPDRSAGILVEADGFGLSMLPVPGDTLHLRGYTSQSAYKDPTDPEQKVTFSGMRILKLDAVPTQGTPSHVDPLKPLGTILRPVSTGTGAPLDGLFVKVGGLVINSDMMAGTFEINDGSGDNIKVAYCYGMFPMDGDLVALTGCIVSTNGARWLYITPDDEIQYFAPTQQ